jgi:hypothetical protein
MLSLFFATVLAAQAPDVSAAAQAALDQHHFYQVTGPGTEVTLHDVVVPAGAIIDGAGMTIHVPANAKCGVKLAGVGAKARDLTMICDVGDIFSDPKHVDPSKLPQMLPIGIDCAESGTRVTDCTLTLFGTGIYSNPPRPEIAPGGETMIDGCQVINPITIGIDFKYPTDSFVRNCIVSRTIGAKNGNPLGLGQIGVRFSGGGGYFQNNHVWGNFLVGLELGGADAIVSDDTIEGSTEVLVRLMNWRIMAHNLFLFFPIGHAKTVAIQAGYDSPSLKKDCSQCHIEATIGSNGGYDYKAIIQHVHDTLGNDYKLTFNAPSGWPEIKPGPKDEVTTVINKSVGGSGR